MLNFFKNIIRNSLSKKFTFSDKGNYKDYLQTQHDRSLIKYKQIGYKDIEKKRKDEFNNLIAKYCDFTCCSSALVVGCRNSYELDLLQQRGFKNVLGVDLFSFDERIKVIDMHDMNIFKNNFFDLVISSHSLEHSFDYEKVIDEIFRVLKNEGILVIEVPVNYKTQEADIHDFMSAENVIKIIKNKRNIKQVLVAQNITKENCFSGTDISRVIISISK